MKRVSYFPPISLPIQRAASALVSPAAPYPFHTLENPCRTLVIHTPLHTNSYDSAEKKSYLPGHHSHYHGVSRYVHLAFLCGRDERTGQCFEHRRQWIEDRLLELSRMFALDVCAYAVMRNHYHVVHKLDTAQAATWDLRGAIERWHPLCKGSALSQGFVRNETLGSAELARLSGGAESWRSRLADISWFMRCLKESTAPEANGEDRCADRL